MAEGQEAGAGRPSQVSGGTGVPGLSREGRGAQEKAGSGGMDEGGLRAREGVV